VRGSAKHGVAQSCVTRWASEAGVQRGGSTVGRKGRAAASATPADADWKRSRIASSPAPTAAQRGGSRVRKGNARSQRETGTAAPPPSVSKRPRVGMSKPGPRPQPAADTVTATLLKGARVAKLYTPTQRAEVLEHAAEHGATVAAEKFKVSRFSIYAWQRRVAKAAKGEGDSPTSGAAPKDIEAQRDREILGEWSKHPGLGPSQIRNQLRRASVKVSVNTVRRVMEDAGYRPPKVKREPHDQRYEAVRPNHLWHLDFLHRHINRQSTFTLIIIDDCSRYVVGHGVDDAERADVVVKTFEEAVERHGRPERVMQDKGSAFWSWRGISRFTELLTEMGIDQLIADHKEWNGKIEVFNANLSKERLRRAEVLRCRRDEAAARRPSSLVQPLAHAPRGRRAARARRPILWPR